MSDTIPLLNLKPTCLRNGMRSRFYGGWQTKITRRDGRLAALVIQTQIVIPAEKS
jgi:hypothetical protein